MSDSNTYSTADDLTKLFSAAADLDRTAVMELSEILQKAEPRQCEGWDELVHLKWEGGLQGFAKSALAKPLDEAGATLVGAMLTAGLEGTMFRNLYAMLVKAQFPEYADPAGLLEALGVLRETEQLSKVGKRFEVMKLLKRDAFCYTQAFGLGRIGTIDDISNEVKVVFAKRQTLGLRNVLDNLMLIDSASEVYQWLDKKVRPPKMPLDELNAKIGASMASVRPALLNPARALLVPGILNEAQLKAYANVVAKAKKEGDNVVEVTGEDVSQRWDNSRSLLELNERLKTVAAIEKGEYNIANIMTICKHEAERDEHATQLATALATLASHLLDSEVGDAFVQRLIENEIDKSVVWQKDELFAEASDKISGKLAYPWFKVTVAAKGPEYLVEHTITLPYRLWASTEKCLDTVEKKQLLTDCVAQALAKGDVSADALYWLWKSGEEDLKGKYLTNTVLLFRTLQKEVKGSYLKAYRDLFKLLMNDEAFQRQAMNYGDENTVTEFIHCVKRMPLLEAADRQSLEVKINRLYPEFKHLIEEKKTIKVRAALPRITSWRSLKRTELILKNLIEERIPANAAALEHARSLGDLRENSEFKFAKEQQALLGKERTKLEKSLADVRGTDFHDVEVNDAVVLGSAITIKYSESGVKTFYLLGLLDNLTSRNMISYETPLAQLLLGHVVGDRLTMPNGERGEILSVSKLPEEMIDWFNGEPTLDEDK